MPKKTTVHRDYEQVLGDAIVRLRSGETNTGAGFGHGDYRVFESLNGFGPGDPGPGFAMYAEGQGGPPMAIVRHESTEGALPYKVGHYRIGRALTIEFLDPEWFSRKKWSKRHALVLQDLMTMIPVKYGWCNHASNVGRGPFVSLPQILPVRCFTVSGGILWATLDNGGDATKPRVVRVSPHDRFVLGLSP